MTKNELESGMIVQSRDGNFGLYLKDKVIIWKCNKCGNDTEATEIKYYSEDLKYLQTFNESDIIKVFQYDDEFMLQSFFDKRFDENDLTLLWERKEEKVKYVKIIKSSKETYWYANKIGKVYKSMYENDFGYNLQTKGRVISYLDCVEVSKSEYKEDKKTTHQVKYIKIVKCDSDKFWYFDKIGKVYKVKDESFKYIMVSKGRFINPNDYIEISDLEYKELNIGDTVKIKKGNESEGEMGKIIEIDTTEENAIYKVKIKDNEYWCIKEDLKKVK